MAATIGYVSVLGQDNLTGFEDVMDWENNKWTIIAGGAAVLLILAAIIKKKGRKRAAPAYVAPALPAPSGSVRWPGRLL